MAQLACEVKNTKELNVGDLFSVTCRGDLPNFNYKNIELRLDEAEKNCLKLIKIEKKDASTLDLLVTSYNVGPNKLSTPQLVDAENSVLLSNIQFTVKSVIENPQEQKPYGPLGPFSIGFPWIYAVVPILMVALISSLIARGITKKRKKLKLLDERPELNTSVSPIDQLYRGLRTCEKLIDNEDSKAYILEIEKVYKIFISRLFRTPALDVDRKEVFKDIRRFDKGIAKSVQKDLNELDFMRDKKLSRQQKLDLMRVVQRHSENFMKITGDEGQ